jgi:hypothetical protein
MCYYIFYGKLETMAVTKFNLARGFAMQTKRPPINGALKKAAIGSLDPFIFSKLSSTAWRRWIGSEMPTGSFTTQTVLKSENRTKLNPEAKKYLILYFRILMRTVCEL